MFAHNYAYALHGDFFFFKWTFEEILYNTSPRHPQPPFQLCLCGCVHNCMYYLYDYVFSVYVTWSSRNCLLELWDSVTNFFFPHLPAWNNLPEVISYKVSQNSFNRKREPLATADLRLSIGVRHEKKMREATFESKNEMLRIKSTPLVLQIQLAERLAAMRAGRVFHHRSVGF